MRLTLKKWLIIGRTLADTKTSNVVEFAVTVWAYTKEGANGKFDRTFNIRHADAVEVSTDYEILKKTKA